MEWVLGYRSPVDGPDLVSGKSVNEGEVTSHQNPCLRSPEG
jgi:hypothetical protein